MEIKYYVYPKSENQSGDIETLVYTEFKREEIFPTDFGGNFEPAAAEKIISRGYKSLKLDGRKAVYAITDDTSLPLHLGIINEGKIIQTS